VNLNSRKLRAGCFSGPIFVYKNGGRLPQTANFLYLDIMHKKACFLLMEYSSQ